MILPFTTGIGKKVLYICKDQICKLQQVSASHLIFHCVNIINTKHKRCNGNSHVTATLGQWWAPKDHQGVLPSIHNSLRLPAEISKDWQKSLCPLRDYFLPRTVKGSKNHSVSFVVSIAVSCRLSLDTFAVFFPPSRIHYHLGWMVSSYTHDVFQQSQEPARHLSVQLKIHLQHQKWRNANQRQPIMPLSTRRSINLQN